MIAVKSHQETVNSVPATPFFFGVIIQKIFYPFGLLSQIGFLLAPCLDFFFDSNVDDLLLPFLVLGRHETTLG